MLLACSRANRFQGAGFELTVGDLHVYELKQVIFQTVRQEYDQIRQLIHLETAILLVSLEDGTGKRINQYIVLHEPSQIIIIYFGALTCTHEDIDLCCNIFEISIVDLLSSKLLG